MRCGNLPTLPLVDLGAYEFLRQVSYAATLERRAEREANWTIYEKGSARLRVVIEPPTAGQTCREDSANKSRAARRWSGEACVGSIVSGGTLSVAATTSAIYRWFR